MMLRFFCAFSLVFCVNACVKHPSDVKPATAATRSASETKLEPPAPIELCWPGNKRVKYLREGQIVVFDVPAGQDGKAWLFRGFKSWEPIRVLNQPSSFSFFSDTLMVPAEAVIKD